MRKVMVLLASVALVTLVAVQIPRARAATTIHYFTGFFECTGTLTVAIANMGGQSARATAIARDQFGIVVDPSAGSSMLEAAAKATSAVQYDCGGGKALTLELITHSGRVIPSAEPNLVNGGHVLIAGGEWRRA